MHWKITRKAFAASKNPLASRKHCPGCGSCGSKAFARFGEVGFPTTRDEDWRFTNISAISRTPFRLAGNGRSRSHPKRKLSRSSLAGAACQLVFVDGRFASELSSMGQLPAHVTVRSLAAQLATEAGTVEPHLGRYLDTKRDSAFRA